MGTVLALNLQALKAVIQLLVWPIVLHKLNHLAQNISVYLVSHLLITETLKLFMKLVAVTGVLTHVIVQVHLPVITEL